MMKIFVKTLKGSQFEIEVNPGDTVADVKKNVEATQGRSVYPAEQQMLIHQGKVLKDDTTLEDNKVAENSFVVVMLSKTKASSSGTSTQSKQPASQALNASAEPRNPPTPVSAPIQASTVTTAPASPSTSVDVYGQAASNLVAGTNFEETIQQILDMGGGSWDKNMVVRALRAAYNNPERAIEYLYSGIPAEAEAPPVANAPANPPVQATVPVQPAVPSSGPNANPLDLFPQGLPSMGSNAAAGSLDFLRNTPQFRALQAMVQANPQILQPMLQELGKHNPQIMTLIQEHQADFLRLINEPSEEGESDPLSQLASGSPQAVTVTEEEHEAIERLEAMGFERAVVLEAYFACNKNEELAANYLLDHMHEFED